MNGNVMTLPAAAAPRIVLTGGGSSGHVVPTLPIGDMLEARGYEIHYIGSADGPEKGILQSRAWPFHVVSVDKLRRYGTVKNLAIPLNLIRGLLGARKTLKAIGPKVVFSKGGYVAVPVTVAAWSLGIPIVAHESDLSPGLANRISLPLCRKLCTTFPARYLKSAHPEKQVFTGLPLRAEFFAADPKRAETLFGLTGDKPVLMVFGGSSGSVAINTALRGCLNALTERFQVVHLAGKGNLDPTLDGRAGYTQLEYIHDGMGDLLARADVVVSRAGMTSVVELIAMRKAAVLIPLPLSASRGDQIENAELVGGLGLFEVLPQADLAAETLSARIEAALARSPAPDRMAAFDALAIPVTADAVVEVIEGVVKGRGTA